MFKNTIILSLFSICLFANQIVLSQTAGSSVKIEISNIQNDQGDVGCLIFNSPDGYPENHSKALKETHVPIRSGSAICEFKTLTAGEYAVIVFHDENLNGILDKNFLGIPREGYMASNNIRPPFSAPGFKEAAFTIDPNAVKTLKITMGY